MTYYGRWTYKFEEAARRGAAAVIIVHETEPAAYGWQVVRNSNTGAKYYLDKPNGNADLAVVHSWITTEVAKDLFARAGLDYDELRLAANKRGFKAVPMKGLKLNADTHSAVAQHEDAQRHRRRRRAREARTNTCSTRRIGITSASSRTCRARTRSTTARSTTRSGCAAILEIAEAFAKGPKPPRRSVMFAFVTLEEQGLLGSEYLAEASAGAAQQDRRRHELRRRRPIGPVARHDASSGSGALARWKTSWPPC